MATDRVADLGMSLAELSEDTLKKLNAVLPVTWSQANPVDVIGDATPERYARAVEICMSDPGVDGLLVDTDPPGNDRSSRGCKVIDHTREQAASRYWRAGWVKSRSQKADGYCVHANVPTFHTPEAAVEAFSYLAYYYQNQKLLLETPGPLSLGKTPDVEGARMIIEGALSEGRKVLRSSRSPRRCCMLFISRLTRPVSCARPTRRWCRPRASGSPWS